MFRDLTNLKELIIRSDLDLNRITRDTFKSLVNVETIILLECDISGIDSDAFSDLTNLKFLAVCHGSLKKFSSVDLPVNLEQLNLSNNQFGSIKDVFNHEKSYTKLTMLDLSCNRIASLPANAFRGLCALRSLELGENKLSKVSDEAFEGLVNLRELDLQKTGLKAIGAGLFASTPKLHKIKLLDIELESVDENAFDRLRSMPYLTVDESSYSLLEHLQKNRKVDLTMIDTD